MRLLFIWWVWLLPLSVWAQIEGRVLDVEGTPLIGVYVISLPDSNVTVTDLNGRFRMSIQQAPRQIRFSHLGFTTKWIDGAAWENGQTVVLQESVSMLEVVRVSQEHAKQEGSLSALHLNTDYMARQGRATLAMTLDQLPGLSAINVGTGIAKPVIRGLFGNRVLVNTQGVKQEGQQWGNDHGLEVDALNVEQIEIVKGPSSLQYGTDALGGVINILPEGVPIENGLEGSLTSIGQSNNRQVGWSAQLKARQSGFFMIGRFSRQRFSDFRVPADRFEYNGFTLPLLGQQVKNTAGVEENIHLTAGYQGTHSITRLSFKQYYLKSGLFSGAVGIPRSYLLQDDGNDRDIGLPYQEVQHQKWTLNQTFIFGEHHWIINAGWQRNSRGEHTNPEFHSVPSSELDPNADLGLGLELETFSVNTHYEWPLTQQIELNIGGNVQQQIHRRSGFEYLLPDYETFRSGLFAIGDWALKEKLHLTGGLRVDYGQNESAPYTQLIYSSNETVLDSLVSVATDDVFWNWAAALGTRMEWGKNQSLKLNAARSFRIPYPNETVSNGVHHGTFRHEQGQPDLQPETGWQFDLSWTRGRGASQLMVDAYFNLFSDYIYLRPSARFSPLPEAGQLFQFVQNDAFFSGFEISYQRPVASWWIAHAQAEAVWSYNLDENIPLPFTPPAELMGGIEHQFGWSSFLRKLNLQLQYQYVFAQNRVDRNELSTPAYHLMHVQMRWADVLNLSGLRLDVQVQNLWNARYLRHLSRYRFLNLPEQGRNLVVRIQYDF